MLFISRGFAYGFSVLSKTAIFSYKCNNFYNKESEGGILLNDVDLNIDWRINSKDMIISEKDKLNKTFEEYKRMCKTNIIIFVLHMIKSTPSSN
jgi:dTDP-4-dehydrorhamnose 3,5-epimerase